MNNTVRFERSLWSTRMRNVMTWNEIDATNPTEKNSSLTFVGGHAFEWHVWWCVARLRTYGRWSSSGPFSKITSVGRAALKFGIHCASFHRPDGGNFGERFRCEFRVVHRMQIHFAGFRSILIWLVRLNRLNFPPLEIALIGRCIVERSIRSVTLMIGFH